MLNALRLWKLIRIKGLKKQEEKAEYMKSGRKLTTISHDITGAYAKLHKANCDMLRMIGAI